MGLCKGGPTLATRSDLGTTSRRDVALVVVASLAFATSGPLGKIAASVPATAVAAARTGLAAVILAVAAPGELVRALRALSLRQRAGVVLAGALLGVHFALFLGGLAATSLASAVALVSLEPLAVVLAALLAFGIRPTRREIWGLVVAMVGAVVVATAEESGEHRLEGDLLVVGAVVVFGAYVAAARGLRNAMPVTSYAATVYGTASLVLFPLAVPLTITSGLPSRRAAAAIFALALVPTLIGHTLVQRVARRAPPILVALVSPGETLGAIAIGAIVMGKVPTARELGGAALILSGALLALTRPKT